MSMLYVIGAYWPFLILMLVDDLTAWLERGPDEP